MSINSFDSTWAMLQIDQLCDQFERAWQSNSNPRIESFIEDFIRRLPATPEAAAAGPADQARRNRLIGDLVEDLVAVEVAYRRRHGAQVAIEEYQARFPNQSDAVARAFAGLDSKGDNAGNLDSPTSVSPLRRNNVSSDKPGAKPLICSECFRELTPAPGGKDQVIECPGCGKSYAPNADAATTAGLTNPPAGIQLPARFQFQSVLGQGAFGIVCKAWDKTLQRPVAIKSPRASYVDKDLFLHEARASSRLRHPNIVRVYDYGEIDGSVYIVSDFISGISLRYWRENQSRSVADICRILIQIAETVHYSHENGVVHRDLKPGNIVVDESNKPNVLDFGLSHSIRQPEDRIASSGHPFGTPAFMSPEQVLAMPAEIDRRTDIYSMGVILFQLLTKQLPFSGSSKRIFQEIVGGEPKRPRDINRRIPLALEAICRKAMARNREERYESAAAMADDLRRFMDGRIVSSYPHWQPRVLVGFARRNFLRLAIASTILLAGVSAWLFFQPRGTDEILLQRVVINSSPPGATLHWIRYDDESAELIAESDTPSIAGEPIDLPPGQYKIVATSGTEYFEVLRTVPRPDQLPVQSVCGVPLPQNHFVWDSGTAVLDEIKIIPVLQLGRDLARIPGGTVEIPNEPQFFVLFAGKSNSVSDFLIDRGEVTFGDLRAVFPQITGLPDEPDKVPVHSITHDVAIAYAEKVGMNLPTYWEFVWAATNQGTTRYSWGSQQPELQLEKVFSNPSLFSDQTPNDPPIRNLILGRAEWTETNRTGISLPPPAPGMGLGFIPGSLGEFMVFGPIASRAEFPNAPKSWPRAATPGSFYFSSSVKDNTGFRCVRRLKK